MRIRNRWNDDSRRLPVLLGQAQDVCQENTGLYSIVYTIRCHCTELVLLLPFVCSQTTRAVKCKTGQCHCNNTVVVFLHKLFF